MTYSTMFWSPAVTTLSVICAEAGIAAASERGGDGRGSMRRKRMEPS